MLYQHSVGRRKHYCQNGRFKRRNIKLNVGTSNGLSFHRASSRPQYWSADNPSVGINSFCGKRQRSGKLPMYHPSRRASSRSAQGHLAGLCKTGSNRSTALSLQKPSVYFRSSLPSVCWGEGLGQGKASGGSPDAGILTCAKRTTKLSLSGNSRCLE